MTAVMVRSYSRMIDQTSVEQNTGSSGASRVTRLATLVLVGRVSIRVDEGNHNPLGAQRAGAFHRSLHTVYIHRFIHRAVTEQTLGDRDHALLGNKRAWPFRQEVVDIGES